MRWIHSGSAVWVMYDSACAQALTCEISRGPYLGTLAVYRVSAAPLYGRIPPPFENSPIRGPIGDKTRKGSAETSAPVPQGRSADQFHKDGERKCVSSSSAVPPSSNDQVRDMTAPDITHRASPKINDGLLLAVKSANEIASVRNTRVCTVAIRANNPFPKMP